MASLVIDASIAAAWCFPDERIGYANAVLRALSMSVDALAPRLWAYELRNSVLMGMRRKRITASDADEFLKAIGGLPIQFEDPISYGEVFRLADRHGLTFYDAAYLELAVREALPLASLDHALCEAASRAGVSLFQPS